MYKAVCVLQCALCRFAFKWKSSTNPRCSLMKSEMTDFKRCKEALKKINNKKHNTSLKNISG